jgi:hypothetical protein
MGNEPQPGGQKLQGSPQETPGDTPTTKADVPGNSDEPKLYTEKELQAKLSEQRSQDRKGYEKTLQPLRDKINTLEADKTALETQSEDVEVLKQIAEKLKAEIDEGIPSEAKEIYEKYAKKLAGLTEAEIRSRKDIKAKEEKLSVYEKKELSTLADELVKTFGVDKEALVGCKNETEMRVKATELYKPESAPKPVEQEVKGQEPAKTVADAQPVTKVPALETAPSASGVLSDAEFWKSYGKMEHPTSADHKRASEIRTKALKGG